MLRKLFLLGLLGLSWPLLAADPVYDALAIRVVLFPIHEATLSATVESRVSRIDLKEGESFTDDDVLIELDDLVFRQRVERARAAAETARDELAVATDSYERAVETNQKNPDMRLFGIEEMERKKLAVSAAQAKSVAQEAEVVLAERELSSCRIEAPFPGRLIKWLINPYEYVRPGQALVFVLDDTQVLAAMHLPSHVRPHLSVGRELEIALDDLPGRTFRGSVHEIGGNIDAASRTFELKVLIDNPDGLLVSGMAGHLVSDVSALLPKDVAP